MNALDAMKRALEEYPGRNTHQLQARKVCEGVLALAAITAALPTQSAGVEERALLHAMFRMLGLDGIEELPGWGWMYDRRTSSVDGMIENGTLLEHFHDWVARNGSPATLVNTALPNKESIDRAAVAAWWRVAQTLDKLCPDWSANDLDGADAAEQAIAAALRTPASEGDGMAEHCRQAGCQVLTPCGTSALHPEGDDGRVNCPWTDADEHVAFIEACADMLHKLNRPFTARTLRGTAAWVAALTTPPTQQEARAVGEVVFSVTVTDGGWKGSLEEWQTRRKPTIGEQLDALLRHPGATK